MSESAVTAIAVVARAIAFASIVLACGAVAFRWAVLARWREPWPASLATCAVRVARAGAFASVCLVVVAPVRLFAQARALVDAGDPVLPMMGNVLSTTWGHGWLLQALASLIMFAGLILAARGSRAGWSLALASSLALTLSPSLMGHAIAGEHLPFVSVLADWIHVAMAATWIGALASLAIVAVTADAGGSGEPLATIIDLFHPVALTSSAVLVAAGIAGLLFRVEGVDALIHSTYGFLLAFKLLLTAAVAAVGFHHSRHAARLVRERGRDAVIRTLAAELALAALVIATTAALVGTAPPTRMQVASQWRERHVHSLLENDQ